MAIDRRLLIADDDVALRTSMAEFLGDLGLAIVQVETGSEALDVLRQRSIRLALLDMHMPGYTGLELLSAVRRETLDVPCIFCSGDLTEALRAQAVLEGALAVLRKPVDPALLRSEVRRVLALGWPPS